MWRAFKVLIFLTALGALGLVAYAYIGPLFFAEDFAPPIEEVTKPVTLDLD